MVLALTPARRRGVEILDNPDTPADVRDRAMVDIARSNRLFGGARAATGAVRRLFADLPRQGTLLDVGTGLADIPARVRVEARDAGLSLRTIGADVSVDVLRWARPSLDAALCADAMRLPLADASVDVVTCSQLLHHFEADDASAVIAELHRVARGWIVISDLRRSWLAAIGYWLAAAALRFHRVTRHDGFVSVLRGFTALELERLVRDATGVEPTVRRGVFWRLTAVWRKTPPPHSVVE